MKRGFSLLGLLRSYSSFDYSALYFSEIRVKDVELYSSFVSLNSYLRNEVPLLNTRVRKSYNYYMSEFRFFGIGVGSNYFTYPVRVISNNTFTLRKILGGKHFISRLFMSLKTRLVLFYKSPFYYFFSGSFRSRFNPAFVSLERSVSSLSANHVGVSHSLTCLSTFIYSVGLGLESSYTPTLYQGHHGNINTSGSLIVMPTALFAEKSSNYLNLEGLLQKSHMAVSADKLVKKDWEIFVALVEFQALFFDQCSKFSYLDSVFYKTEIFAFNALCLPFWVENNSYYYLDLNGFKFYRNYLFSLEVLNYYWNDLMSQNSKIMAKCASLLTNNNISY